jgi:CMD domain protein
VVATNKPDLINALAGLEPGSALAELRARRPETLAFSQGSYLALLEPDEPDGVSRWEREAIAFRVATLERSQVVADFHLSRLLALGADESAIAAITDFPDGGIITERLRAILAHTDLLTNSARNGSPTAIAALRAAGLEPKEIVTLSQLIAFLSFEIRILATLRALGEVA